MAKFVKRCATILALVMILTTVLVGCQSFKWKKFSGYDTSALIESNGGYAVKQGNHLYFVNGKADSAEIKEAKDNYFGKAEKGAIMRGTLGSDGTLSDVEIIVPKKVLSTSKTSGIFIFGDWIYYASPTTSTDNNGKVATEYLDFMRTSLNAQKTQVIATVKGVAVDHKFTSTGLIWLENAKLNCVTFTDKKIGRQTVLAEDVTGVVYAETPNYKNGEERLSECVFYTKNGEATDYVDSQVWAINANKTVNKQIMGANTYTDKPAEDSNMVFSFKPIKVVEYGDKLEIYYEKSTYTSGSAVVLGVFGNEFASNEFVFDTAKEKQFTVKTETSIFPISLSEGIILTGSVDVKIAKDKDNHVSLGMGDKFDAVITPFKIDNVNVGGTKVPFLYYMDGNKVMRLPLDASVGLNAQKMTDTATDSAWYHPDIIGEYLYYLNTDKYSYTYRISLNSSEKDKDGKLIDHLLGKMTETDQKEFDKKYKTE